MRTMPKHEFLGIACLLLFVTLLSSAKANNCEAKEKALTSLEIAGDLISKAKHLLPNCSDNSDNTSECGAKEKVSVYLDMAQKLILEEKENYPTCIGKETKDPNIQDPLTVEPETTDTVTEPEPKEPVTEPETKSTVTEPETKSTVTEPETKSTVTEPEPKEYTKIRDCSEVMRNEQNTSGVYTIWPDSPVFPNRSIEVFCDMENQGGGWTVIQRRGNFTPQENFYRGWSDYKSGFGNLTRDFWLGNDNLFILSNQRKYLIRFDLVSVDGEKAYAEYKTFRVDDEKANYKLHIGSYSGDAGESMIYHNGMLFSTKDRRNDNGGDVVCAERGKGGWWYNSCSETNPNGEYEPAVADTFNTIHWATFKGMKGQMASVEIKIKLL